MIKYVLWDVPTSTLLLETGNVEEARRSVDAFVQGNGASVLEELLLGIEPSADAAVASFTGSDIISELNRREPGRHRSSLRDCADRQSMM